MLTSNQITSFYENWNEPPCFKEWSGLWRKQYKIQTVDGRWIKLNNIKPRLGYRSLKKLLVKFAPLHVYHSVLDYLQPEKVGPKPHKGAYPVGGQFVIDLDHYMSFMKHRHRTEPGGFCYGCLENARKLTLRVLECVEIYYDNIHLVFSGKTGFHIHVRDFKIRDWTYYDSANPLKSHEVARRRFVDILQEHAPKAFDHAHYVLSCDTTRVITVPESLNGETGLVCKYLGSPDMFRELSIHQIVELAKRKQHITQGLNWTTASEWRDPRFNLLHAHHEPTHRAGR